MTLHSHVRYKEIQALPPDNPRAALSGLAGLALGAWACESAGALLCCGRPCRANMNMAHLRQSRPDEYGTHDTKYGTHKTVKARIWHK